MSKLNLRLWVCIMLAVLHVRRTTQYNVERRVKPNPGYPGKCYDEVTNAAYDIDEMWIQKGECAQYKCSQANNSDFFITAYGCTDTSKFENDVHCWIMKGDLSNPYPSCCSVVVCA